MCSPLLYAAFFVYGRSNVPHCSFRSNCQVKAILHGVIDEERDPHEIAGKKQRIERQQTFEIRRQQTLEMNEMNEIERQQTKKVKRQTLHAAET